MNTKKYKIIAIRIYDYAKEVFETNNLKLAEDCINNHPDQYWETRAYVDEEERIIQTKKNGKMWISGLVNKNGKTIY